MKTAVHVAQPDASAVLTKATIRTGSMLGLSGAALGKVLGLSEATVSRMHSGGRTIDPHSKEGELAALLIRLFRSLDAMVGNDTQRRMQWLTSYNDAFNAVPREFVQGAEGLVRAVTYLDGMRATV